MKKIDVALVDKNGVWCVSSLDVAQHFGKLHKNVLRDVENLECSQRFNKLNFEPISYFDIRGRNKPAVLMTRDGFTRLVMGFSGKLAAEWIERYIEAFNEMERLLLESKDVEVREATKRLQHFIDTKLYRVREYAKEHLNIFINETDAQEVGKIASRISSETGSKIEKIWDDKYQRYIKRYTLNVISAAYKEFKTRRVA